MSAEVHGVSPAQGRRIGKAIEKEIQQLESAFSLYSSSSELSRLNSEKLLDKPSAHFVALVEKSHILNQRTLGYFQPAVHGVWAHRELRLQDPSAWKNKCNAASLENLTVSNGSIKFTRTQTALSFNAIVQGYLADQVQGYLRSHRVESAMLHLGESYAIGQHPEGRPWSLAVTGTSEIVGIVQLSNTGMAVSANAGNRELINPRDWSVSRENRTVAVVSAEGAAVADAFATAFAVAPKHVWPRLHAQLAKGGECQVKVWVKDELTFSR